MADFSSRTAWVVSGVSSAEKQYGLRHLLTFQELSLTMPILPRVSAILISILIPRCFPSGFIWKPRYGRVTPNTPSVEIYVSGRGDWRCMTGTRRDPRRACWGTCSLSLDDKVGCSLFPPLREVLPTFGYSQSCKISMNDDVDEPSWTVHIGHKTGLEVDERRVSTAGWCQLRPRV